MDVTAAFAGGAGLSVVVVTGATVVGVVDVGVVESFEVGEVRGAVVGVEDS